MTTVQPAGDGVDLVDDLRSAASSARRQAESAIRMSGPTAVMGEAYALRSAADRHDQAADTIEALRSRIAGLEKALEPFAVLANDYLADTVNFDDDTVMAGRIVSRRKEDGTPPRVTFAHFRAARSAINLIRGDE